jgi:RNA polymerase sigma factor (sigma-70 family)
MFCSAGTQKTMAKPEFAAAPILNLTLMGLWSGDAKRPASRNRARSSRCFGVATFLYRADHRGHFFAAAATAMRRILIERARRKQRKIHGGGRRRQEFDPEQIVAPAPSDELLALDAALAKLGEQDPVKSRLVELRFFAGLTGDQAALILGISPKTADRYWVYARAWLRREMEGGDPVRIISEN